MWDSLRRRSLQLLISKSKYLIGLDLHNSYQELLLFPPPILKEENWRKSRCSHVVVPPCSDPSLVPPGHAAEDERSPVLASASVTGSFHQILGVLLCNILDNMPVQVTLAPQSWFCICQGNLKAHDLDEK